MNVTRLFCAAVLCLSGPLAAAAATGAPAASPGKLCSAAIAAVERSADLPPHLLDAIGLVESGRRDPRNGAWGPWPWTIDVAGQPAFFETEAQAIAAVRAAQARGAMSIDVGCMQVNLLQHPQAFATLEAAFDPATNVRYGARFLAALFVRSKAWPAAAGLYHSATPVLGEAYRRKVMAAWPEAARFGGVGGIAPTVMPRNQLARAWASTLSGASGFGWTVRMVPQSSKLRDTRVADLDP